MSNEAIAKKFKVNATWKPVEHAPLNEIAPGVFHVDAAIPGMAMRRAMTLIKTDGGVIIHNAVCVSEELMRQIERLGPVQAIVVPNGWHRLDVLPWKTRFASARIVAPAGSKARIEQVVAVNDTYDVVHTGDPTVRFTHLDGTKNGEGVVDVERDGHRTLVFNDAFFNHKHMPGVVGFIVKHLAGSTGGPKVSRIFSMMMLKDRAALRAQFAAWAGTTSTLHLVPGHGDVVTVDAQRILKNLL
jgi:hypothetical protein